jgi:hypothetical protein
VDLLTIADWVGFAAYITFCAAGFVQVRRQLRR